jgi:DNA polymerase-3 subunit alpha
VLRESLGVMLYDDDVLGVIEALTGRPASEADNLRKRLTDPQRSAEAEGAFLGLCERNGVPREAAELVLGQIARFAAYSFCKAHAVGVANVCWQEAQLKARHPLAFWTAVLNNHEGSYPKRVHVEAAKRAGVSVFLPCVNRSKAGYAEEVAGIRVGLSSIRTLDQTAVEAIVQDRQQGGVYQSLTDFRNRVNTISPQDLALLIRAGAFDFTGRSRAALLRDADLGQRGRLPAWWEGRDEFEPWPFEGLLAGHPLAKQWKEEWELLGFLCSPTLMSLARTVAPPDLADSRTLGELVGARVRLVGLVASAKETAGESQDLTLEDEWGLIPVRAVGAPPGAVVIVEGEVAERYGVPHVIDATLERLLPGGTGPKAHRPAGEPHHNGPAAERNGSARPV